MATDIIRYRSNTKPYQVQILDADGNAQNVTGYSFTLTVDPSRRPADASNNVISLAGTITDASSGLVEFQLSAGDAAITPGAYFYDIEMTDAAGKISTIEIGSWYQRHDITIA